MSTEQALVLALQQELEATRAQLDTLQKECEWMRKEYESLQEEACDQELQAYLCARCHHWVDESIGSPDSSWINPCIQCDEAYCYQCAKHSPKTCLYCGKANIDICPTCEHCFCPPCVGALRWDAV